LRLPRITSTVPLNEVSAEALALRAQRGDSQAAACFEELVRRYEGRLFNFLARRGGREHAEDLTQEAFVRAWERLESYDPTWRFSTWLFTIGSRLAITRHRRAKPTVGPAALESAPAPTERVAEQAELGAKLWSLAFQHLTEDQQTALWLRYVEDMAVADIARVMDKSDVGVRVCLFRARHALAALAGLDKPVGRDTDSLEQHAAARNARATPPALGDLVGGVS